jgi:hypothetical protein
LPAHFITELLPHGKNIAPQASSLAVYFYFCDGKQDKYGKANQNSLAIVSGIGHSGDRRAGILAV